MRRQNDCMYVVLYACILVLGYTQNTKSTECASDAELKIANICVKEKHCHLFVWMRIVFACMKPIRRPFRHQKSTKTTKYRTKSHNRQNINIWVIFFYSLHFISNMGENADTWIPLVVKTSVIGNRIYLSLCSIFIFRFLMFIFYSSSRLSVFL